VAILSLTRRVALRPYFIVETPCFQSHGRTVIYTGSEIINPRNRSCAYWFLTMLSVALPFIPGKAILSMIRATRLEFYFKTRTSFNEMRADLSPK
jgi:hypothetical protein